MHQREQPAAKRPEGRVVIQPADRLHEGAQDVLHQVRGIRVLEAAPPGVAVNRGPVDLDALPPGLAVAQVAQADEQARSRRRQVGHSPRLWNYFGVFKKIYHGDQESSPTGMSFETGDV